MKMWRQVNQAQRWTLYWNVHAEQVILRDILRDVQGIPARERFEIRGQIAELEKQMVTIEETLGAWG